MIKKNKKKIAILQKQYGFSIMEVLVVSGLLGFLALATVQMGLNTFKIQKSSVTISEVNEFSSSLGVYLKQYCSSEFKGKRFPLNSSSNLIITGYKGFGGRGSSDIKEGVVFADKWKIKSLKWEHKKSVGAQNYVREGRTYKMVIGKLSFLLEVIADKNITQPPYHIELPFIIDPSTSKVKDCTTALQTVDICTTIGAEWDASKKSCKPKKNCFLKTSFVNCRSSRGQRPSFSPSSPCESLILYGNDPHAETGYKYNLFGQYVKFCNAESGRRGLCNCPPNTKLVFTEQLIGRGQRSCGKKCSNFYGAVARIYLCMQCEGYSGLSKGPTMPTAIPISNPGKGEPRSIPILSPGKFQEQLSQIPTGQTGKSQEQPSQIPTGQTGKSQEQPSQIPTGQTGKSQEQSSQIPTGQTSKSQDRRK